MSIEVLLNDVKEALNRNTEALLKAAGASASTGAGADKTTKTTKTTKTDEPKIKQEEVNAALIKIKDDYGMPHAKEIIKEFGKVEKMSDIKPAQYQAVYDAAVAKYAELSGENSGSGDDL